MLYGGVYPRRWWQWLPNRVRTLFLSAPKSYSEDEMMPALNFSAESLRELFPEVAPLWRAHWDETEGYRAKDEPYAPQLDQFARLDECGMWRQFCARDEADGRLAGHLGYIVHRCRHTGVMNAIEDYFYLLPAYRRGMNALALIRFAVHELRREGVQRIYMSSKATHDIAPLLKRAGFKQVATFWQLET